MMYKAFLIDQDDTLTRHADYAVYHRASHKATHRLISDDLRHTVPDFAGWQAQHHAHYISGECFFTAIANQYGFVPLDYFKIMHELIDDAGIEHDRDSARWLQALADRTLIFTDAGRLWAEKRAHLLGHGLQMLARDDGGVLLPRKQSGDERWQAALAILSDKVGTFLQPRDVLMIDDSAGVLRRAKSLGFATAHCHFGFPDRDHTAEFTHSIRSVSDLAAMLHA